MDGSTERVRRRRRISEIPQNHSTKIISLYEGSNDQVKSLAEALGHGKEKRYPNRWMTLCPAHNDSNPSLAVFEVDGRLSYRCFRDCKKSAVTEALRKQGLLPDIQDQKVRWFDYTDEDGNLVMSVKRSERQDGGKDFAQYHFDDKGQRIPGLKGFVDKPPVYNLPAVIKAIRDQNTVFIVEGEKHVDRLRELGGCPRMPLVRCSG
ncbi:MAG: hypothetical protein ACWGKN_10435 [Desulfoprunum sp.]